MIKPRSIFLTGVTGTLGKEIVKYLLERTDAQLFLLIRRKNRFSHWDRARKILSIYGLETHLGVRVQVMDGDVTETRLGLNQDDFDILKREVKEFYHIAALTALNGSQEDCFRVNLGGTQEALTVATELRNTGKLERFYYFSTAYVAGSRQTYCSKEDELPERPAHANFYEASKYEAEKAVRAAMREGLPATIFRPSIVVGDSKTGEVSEFNVIYPFLRLFAHGVLRKLPTDLDNSFNIVPIDFVVQASMAISTQAQSVGKTYHLVTLDPPKIRLLLRLRDEEYPHTPEIEVIPLDQFHPDQLDGMERNVFSMLDPYLGYLNDHLTFDASNTGRALQGTDVSFPKTDYDFLKILCRYAFEVGYLITH